MKVYESETESEITLKLDHACRILVFILLGLNLGQDNGLLQLVA